jgi:hypothetical protein
MLNSGIIGVAIGLILLFFLLSLTVSGINEIVETFLRRRAKFLEAGIYQLLASHKDAFYDHALIRQLNPARGPVKNVLNAPPAEVAAEADAEPANPPKKPSYKTQKPSYISARTFSAVVIDLLRVGQLETTSLETDLPASTTPQEITVKDPKAFPTAPPSFDVTIRGETFHVTKTDVPARKWTVSRADPSKAQDHKVDETIALVPGQAPETELLFNGLQKAVVSVDLGPLTGVLESFLSTASRNVEQWRTNVEKWYDDKMDRVGGWYKRGTKVFLFAFGVILAAALNADTLVIGTALYKDATLRGSVTAQAQKVLTDSPECKDNPDTKDNPVACVTTLLDEVKGLNVPLGWPSWPNKYRSWYEGGRYATDVRVPHAGSQWWLKIAGLLLTGLALSLGAPFWFDLLNKVTNFRASGAPPPKAGSDQS